MNRRIAIYLLTVFVLVSACDDSRNGRFAAWLEETDSLMRTRPDSAYALLEGMKDTAGILPLSLRMRYHLLHAKAQNKAYVDFTTDSLLLSLTDYYDRHGTPNEQMLAYYLLGCTYRDMGEAPKAMESYQTALDRVDTTAEDCDYYDLSRVYAQMATVFYKQNLPEDQLYAQRMYEKYAWKAKDTLDALIAYGKRASAYFLNEDYKNMVEVSIKARNKFIHYGYPEHAARQLVWVCSYYLDRHQYDSAYKYLQIYEQKSGWVDSTGHITQKGKEGYYYDKARYLEGTGKLQLAENLYRTLPAYGHAEAGYKGLLSIFYKKNLPDSIAKYAQLFCDANDSVHRKRNSQMTHQVSAMYDYGRHQRLAMETEKELEAAHRTNAIHVALFCLLLLVLGIVVSVIISRKRIRFNLLKVSHQHVVSQYRSLQKDLNMLKGTSQKIKELVADKELQIEKLKKCINDFHTKERLSIFKNSYIAQKFINHYKQKETTLITEKMWKDLENEFIANVCFTTYNETDNLTSLERRILILLLLGFGVKEICTITGNKQPRISALKRQINRKVFDNDDATSLNNNITEYFRIK